MAGYSGTPLTRKLGIKEGFRIALRRAPAGFARHLAPLPRGAKILSRVGREMNLLLLFAGKRAQLDRDFARLAASLTPSGMLWVGWPKKSSGVETDLSFDGVQKLGLGAGLVDNKICALDDTWSGLRFVYRLKDRKGLR